MVFLRGFLIWLLIIATETIHGILRTLYLTPITGDFRARQIAVFTGATLIFFISLIFIKWINAVKKMHLVIIGFLWVILTLVFEISVGRIFGFSWSRILSDYNLAEGGLLPVGLVLMFLSPLVTAKLRGMKY